MTTKALEVGARYDAGDAETGAGVEVGGALGFADAGLAPPAAALPPPPSSSGDAVPLVGCSNVASRASATGRAPEGRVRS